MADFSISNVVPKMDAMKPKIAIFLYSLAGGGAERVVSILLQNLSDQYDITLILMNATIIYDIPKNIPIHLLESSLPNESSILKFLKLPILGWKYSRFCTRYHITVSFSLMNRPNYINVLSKFFGNTAKIIISERGTPSRQYVKSSLQGWINHFLIQWLYQKADLITTNSSGNSQDLKYSFNISKPIIILYNLFDIQAILHSCHLRTPPKNNYFHLITVGRLDKEKNQLLLIETLARLNRKDVKLTVIGTGPLKDQLAKAVIKFDLQTQVEFIGFIDNPFPYLMQSDIFLFASRQEGFPNVLVEALACGCAVISTDCQSGPREILAPETPFEITIDKEIEYAQYGILTPVNNLDLMTQALNTLLDNPNLLANYRQKAIVRAKNFDKSIQLPKYICMLQGIQ